MRSTPWTSAIPTESRYELRDDAGTLLGESESRAEAIRMLHAVVLTQPGREDDVALHTVSADGQVIVREDIFDIELSH